MQAPRPQETRKPGELVFAVFLAVTSLGLLFSAYGIAGFTALSSAGAIPMATTLVMVITSVLVLIRTARAASDRAGSFVRDVVPARIAVIAVMLVVYAFALKPLGFLPVSAVFLSVAIKYLGRRSWVFSVGTGLLSLIGIWLVFRIVFTVLMPTGIVPEGEILAAIRSLLATGKLNP